MSAQRSIGWLRSLVNRISPSEEMDGRPGDAVSMLRVELLGDLKTYDPVLADQIDYLLHQIEAHRIKPPLLPQVALELLAMSQSKEVNFDQMAQLAVTDPAVAARMMELASSPLVSSLGPPKGIKEALVRMGIEGVKQIAFELAYASKTFKRGPHVRLAERAIGHARTTSALCRLLARDVGVHAGLAALTGLVHALGAIVLIDALSQPGGQSAARVRHKREIPGFLVYLCVSRLHPVVTGQMAIHYSLNPQLIQAVSLHHQPLKEASALTRLLYCCDRISPGEPGTRVMPLSEALERSGLDLSEKRIWRLVEPIRTQIAAGTAH